MRIGFISNLTEEDFSFCRKHEIPCVELSCGPDDIKPVDQKEDLKRWKDKYDLDINMVGLFGRDQIADDKDVRVRNNSDAKKVIDFCAEMEAPVMVAGPGLDNGRDFNTNCQRAVDFFGDLIEYGKPRGVKIALYNCHWANFAYSPQAWDVILNQLPELGIKYDPSHPYYDGRDYLKEMRDWGHRFYHIHAKGSLMIEGEPFEDPPPGLDDINWGAFFAILYHHNYQGDVNYEPHSKTWLGERRYAGVLLAKKHLEQFLC